MRRNWYREWPFWTTMMIVPLNMEVVVVPLFLIRFLGLSGINLIIGGALCTAFEVSYWYWFTGWLLNWLKEGPTVQNAISFSKDKVAPRVKEAGLILMINGWVRIHIIDRFNPDNYTKKKLFQFIRGLSYLSGCLALFFIGTWPILWFTGLIVCRSTKWKIGLCSLVLGNIVKNLGFGTGISILWDTIF